MTTALHRDVQQAGRFARAVAARRASITAAVTMVLEQLVAFRLITPSISTSTGHYLEWALGAAGFLGGLKWVHAGVTPADPALAPRSAAGEQLVTDTIAAAVAKEYARQQAAPGPS